MARTQEELEGAARFICYEIAAMARGGALAAWAKAGNDAHWEGIGVEIFLIHYRALREFLGSTGTHDDDIRASDYVQKPPPWADGIENEKDTINKRLPHLSYERLKVAGKDWELSIGPMAEHMRKALQGFFGELQHPPEQQWFTVNTSQNPWADEAQRFMKQGLAGVFSPAGSSPPPPDKTSLWGSVPSDIGTFSAGTYMPK